MQRHLRGLVAALVLLAACRTAALAASPAAPPVRVQSQSLRLPERPADLNDVQGLPRDGDIVMPFVVGGPPGVAARINDTLWQDTLDLPAPSQSSQTWTPDPAHLPRGTMSLRFTARPMPRVAPRLLSLKLTGEACGAYCEDFSRTLNFNLEDGSLLKLADLVDQRGLTTMAREVRAQRVAAYRRQIRKIQLESRRAPRNRPASEGGLEDELLFNQDCLQQALQAPDLQAMSYAEWIPQPDGGLTLILGRCSNHAMRSLDAVDRIAVPMPAARIRPTLTATGRKILGVR